MSKKAIAVKTIFIISVMMIFTFFVVSIFFPWADWTKAGASSFSCKAKLYSYCSDWKKTDFTNKPDWNWNEKLKGCDEFDITEPVGEEGINRCKSLLGIA